MKITICSSIDFTPKIIEVKAELEKMGHEVNIPYFTQKIINGDLTFEEFMTAKEKNGGDILFREAESMDMIKRYWNFIKDSDAILVLNLDKKGISNYIGGSTLMEMGFAYGQDKKIFLFNPIPAKSERIHYVDELMDMKPIITNGDLTLIK
jgi:nucleoside 2-deoxyribosyltransferase